MIRWDYKLANNTTAQLFWQVQNLEADCTIRIIIPAMIIFRTLGSSAHIPSVKWAPASITLSCLLYKKNHYHSYKYKKSSSSDGTKPLPESLLTNTLELSLSCTNPLIWKARIKWINTHSVMICQDPCVHKDKLQSFILSKHVSMLCLDKLKHVLV